MYISHESESYLYLHTMMDRSGLLDGCMAYKSNGDRNLEERKKGLEMVFNNVMRL